MINNNRHKLCDADANVLCGAQYLEAVPRILPEIIKPDGGVPRCVAAYMVCCGNADIKMEYLLKFSDMLGSPSDNVALLRSASKKISHLEFKNAWSDSKIDRLILLILRCDDNVLPVCAVVSEIYKSNKNGVYKKTNTWINSIIATHDDSWNLK